MDITVLVLAATATAFATGLGAIPVFLFGRRAEKFRPLLLGTTVGLMSVAALVGLLRPALQEGGAVSVLGGLIVGVAFLVAVGLFVDRPNFQNGRLKERGSGSPCSSSRCCSCTACRRDSPSERPTPRTAPGSACS